MLKYPPAAPPLQCLVPRDGPPCQRTVQLLPRLPCLCPLLLTASTVPVPPGAPGSCAVTVPAAIGRSRHRPRLSRTLRRRCSRCAHSTGRSSAHLCSTRCCYRALRVLQRCRRRLRRARQRRRRCLGWGCGGGRVGHGRGEPAGWCGGSNEVCGHDRDVERFQRIECCVRGGSGEQRVCTLTWRGRSGHMGAMGAPCAADTCALVPDAATASVGAQRANRTRPPPVPRTQRMQRRLGDRGSHCLCYAGPAGGGSIEQ